MKLRKESVDAPTLFGERAKSYDHTMRNEIFWESPKHVLGHVQEFRNELQGCKLLDLGIGTGFTTEPFAEAGAHCYGIDASHKMLAECEKKKIATLINHDIKNVPYPLDAGTFDVVICEGVLYFAKKLQPIFQEVHRLLKTDGIFQLSLETKETTRHKDIMQTHEGPIFKSVFEQAGLVVYQHKELDIENDLSAAGFSIQSKKTFTAGYQRGIDQLEKFAPLMRLSDYMRNKQQLRVTHASYISQKAV